MSLMSPCASSLNCECVLFEVAIIMNEINIDPCQIQVCLHCLR